MDSIDIPLPTIKLNGKNYYDWVSLMEIFLRLQNCYEIVNGSEQRPPNIGKEKKD